MEIIGAGVHEEIIHQPFIVVVKGVYSIVLLFMYKVSGLMSISPGHVTVPYSTLAEENIFARFLYAGSFISGLTSYNFFSPLRKVITKE